MEGETRMTIITNVTLLMEKLTITIRYKKEIEGLSKNNKGTEQSLFTNNMMVYLENARAPTKKLVKAINCSRKSGRI